MGIFSGIEPTNFEGFEMYKKFVAAALRRSVADMDKRTVVDHIELSEGFYFDCFMDGVTPEDAVAEDISNWDED